MPLAETMKLMKTSDGSDVFTISESHLVFLVFLRHFGCVFAENRWWIYQKWKFSIPKTLRLYLYT